MKGTVRVLILAAFASCVVSSAYAQIVPSLLVGHESGVPALDRYNGATGAYIGSFATGSPATNAYQFAYGPDSNLYVISNTVPNPIYKFNGSTGQFVSTFVPSNGSDFTFGPDGNIYRVGIPSTTVQRYSGTTGTPLGTFVSSGLSGGTILHFG